MIEVLIDLVLVSMLATAVSSAFGASLRTLSFSKAKINAVDLANEKMEMIRNKPYNDLVSELGNIPCPATTTPILGHERVNRDGIDFDVETRIYYFDDPFDGLFTGGADLYPYDYKKAEITVRKYDRKDDSANFLARITTNISAKAAETPSNTGIIKFCVVDSIGGPVVDADITIYNSSVNPAVYIHANTLADGCLMVPNLPPDAANQNYHLEATKFGYSTDQTYDRTVNNQNQNQRDVGVIAQLVTPQTLHIDRLSTMSINVVNQDNTPAAGLPIHIEGAKLKWTNPDTPKFVGSYTTDASGHIEIPNMEYDEYVITTATGKYILTTSPYQPVDLKANVLPQIVNIVVSDNSSALAISSVNPLEIEATGTSVLAITGSNIFEADVVKISNGSNEYQAVIGGHHGQSEISVTFDLNNAVIGKYNLIIQKGAEILTQTEGLEIVTP